MDPRLNPHFPSNQPGRVMQDIMPAPVAAPVPVNPAPAPMPQQPQPAPAPQPQLPQLQPASGPAAVQIVDSIPMHQPGQPVAPPPRVSQPTSAPAAQMPAYGSQPPPEEDDLDRILQAVNNRVKAPQPPAKTKKLRVPAPLAGGPRKIKSVWKAPKHLGLIGITSAVVILLTMTAIFAYRQGAQTKLSTQPGKVGTSATAANSIQEAGGVLVRPNDLDDFSQDLQKKLTGLNDSQDFGANALSDQVLGL
jgi:hypothetical protein